MTDTTDIIRQLEGIKIAIENSNGNSFLTVWIPIIVVFIGAFMAHIFNLIEKKRQRGNLKNTVVIWLRSNILPMECFIDSIQRFVEASKSSPAIVGKQLLSVSLDLQCIKEFPIDKMSDALVSRLKVSNKENPELARFFHQLYDSINSSVDSQSKFTESLTLYNKAIGTLLPEWNERFSELLYLIKDDCLSDDLSDSERQFFLSIDLLLHEMSVGANNAEGVFPIEIMQNFVQKVLAIYKSSTLTPRINEFYSSFYGFQAVVQNIVGLYENTIQQSETILMILSSSKEGLSEVLAFYESHRIKGIFSLSNKIT